MRALRNLIVLSCLLALPAAAEYLSVTISEPFIEMHTGPGKAFPVDQVVARGESVSILKRRTDWYKLRTRRGHEGWVLRQDLAGARTSDGDPLLFVDPGLDDYRQRRWEAGMLSGDFDGADLLGAYGAWHFTRNLSLQVSVAEALGDYSDTKMAHIDIVHQPFPQWRVSPYFLLGTGVVETTPHATLVSTEDRSDQTAIVGGGLRVYLSRRFLLRAEYSQHLVLTSRDDNEEVQTWQIALSAFF